MPVDEFLEAVASRDLARLYAVPGVGKKTAGRIILEMRDRLQGLTPPVETAGISGVPGHLRQDVVSALVNLGYVKRIAEKAVVQVLKQESPDGFENLLKSTLRKISR